MSNSGMKTCPECAEEIKLEAKVCRYCGTTFALTRVGYCIRCHKVVATNDLGVCAVCGSRLIDVRLESWEVSGPTVGSQEKKPLGADAPAATPIAGVVAPVIPIDEPDTAEDAISEVASEPSSESELPAVPPEPPERELPPAPSAPPGPPPGVAWTKPGPALETAPPEKELEEKEPEAPLAAPEAEAVKPKPPPVTTSDTVAERLAAFGKREPVAPVTPPPVPPVPAPPATPPPGPPVAPPPGPPSGAAVRPPVSTTPPVAPTPPVASTPPVSPPGVGGPIVGAAATPARAPVEPRPEPAMEKPAEQKPAEPVAAAGTRLGIVPTLAQRAAYPFYLLAVIAVLAMWLINYYWDHSLQGTDKLGSQTLSHFVVDTWDGGMTLVSWQIGAIAIICALLVPTRLLPKGSFRQRGVAKEFAKELRAELGVDMVFKHKWYFQKMMLAFALWAIAIGYLVATLVRRGTFVLQTGGYVTIAALLIGFACSGVMAVRRQNLVAIDEAGRIKH